MTGRASSRHVAIVGSGSIGAGRAIVFARVAWRGRRLMALNRLKQELERADG